MQRHSLCLVTLSLTAIGLSSASASEVDCTSLLRTASQTQLSLPFHAFDQEEMSGWRALHAVGCTAEAATLVERYLIGYEINLRTLKWHHAQLLAVDGKYADAIKAARQALNPTENEQPLNFKWNAYVLATIAFLEKDLDGLRRQLAIIEASVSEEPMNNSNLEIVRGLAHCIEKPYKQAYGCRSTR